MSAIHLVGWNHRHAPVELRERLAFGAEELPAALGTLRSELGAQELAILSTCNRVELLVVPGERAFDPADLLRALGKLRPVDPQALAQRLYHHAADEAVRHLFRVAAGLDSMVVGETQILGQVKEAYAVAQQEGHTGKTLNRLFQRAFHVAKRVHSVTRLGAGGDSVPGVAARLAERIFEDLHGRTTLLVGAGETAELAAVAFRHRGVRPFAVANRTPERAQELARRFGATAAGLDRLPGLLEDADILVACAQTDKPLVDEPMIRQALHARRGEPILALDLGVPRNIDPAAGRLDSLYLFDIDDLEAMVERNRKERQEEIDKSERVVEEGVRETGSLTVSNSNIALIERLRGLAETSIASQPLEHQEVVKKAIGQFLHQATLLLRDGDVKTPGRR